MWDLVKVSVRNVGRNKRRALITMVTVFIGVFVVIGIRGLLNGLQGEIRSGLTRKMHGDVQIHKAGYEDSLEANPYKILIPFDESVARKVKSVEGVLEVTPRLKVMGLLNHQKSQSTTPIMISAFTSDTELTVCPRLQDALQKGKLIDSKKERRAESVEDDDLAEAKGLDDAPASDARTGPRAVGYHQLMVTPSLLRGLGAEIGDEVVVLLQDKDNMQQAIVATLVGVVDFAMPNTAMRMAWMDFDTLRSAVGAGGLTSELAIRTTVDADVDQVRARLQQEMGEGFAVQTWLEIAGLFRDVMAVQNLVFNLILLIVFSIVISAIINTSLMTVMERTREIGTLMALGYRRVHIIFMFLIEAIVISVIGGIAGMLMIGAILFALNVKGLVIALPGQTVTTILYPWVSVLFLIGTLALAMTSALIASFYPAYRASTMRPVQALSST